MDDPIICMGRLFSDGAALDQLSGEQLVLWERGHGQIGPTLVYQSRTYAPATLGGYLREALYLPIAAEDPGSPDALITHLREPLENIAGLDRPSSMLAAVAILATWVAEVLRGPVLINLWGPSGSEMPLVELLGCLCRRALRLAKPSLSQLAGLPCGLSPTLILQNGQGVSQFANSIGQPGTCFVSGGQAVNISCPIIACTHAPVTIPAVKIPLSTFLPSEYMSKSHAEALANHFQPRLLHYRLAEHVKVANSDFDPEFEMWHFSPEGRLVARILGAAVQGMSEIQGEMVEALADLDERHPSQYSEIFLVVLESLLLLCHTDREKAYVGQITELANTLLLNHEENIVLSAKRVGAILRQQLGLVPARESVGYELMLDARLQRKIHDLADLHCMLNKVQTCPFCIEMRAPVATDTPDNPAENESTST